jgi:FkbM family methyltransferase
MTYQSIWNDFTRSLARLPRRRDPSEDCYAQCGEDMIIEQLLSGLQLDAANLRYLDIGTNDPRKMNNTYRLYLRGACGVCVEANPLLVEKIRRHRPNDTCLNVGIGKEAASSATFHVLNPHTLSTFSADEAKRLSEIGSTSVEEVIEIPLMPLQQIVTDYCDGDLAVVSLDIEGDELGILEQFDFDQCRPLVWCVETLSYEEDGSEVKCAATRELFERNDYLLYADTYVNSLFVDANSWKTRYAA